MIESRVAIMFATMQAVYIRACVINLRRQQIGGQEPVFQPFRAVAELFEFFVFRESMSSFL
jgi:hypothetical protein